MTEVIAAGLGFGLGAFVVWLWSADRIRETEALAAERLAAAERLGAEKLALLEGARAKLADTFKALSADALRAANESLVQLAQEKLGRFQEGAKADLEAREKAIAGLAQPIRERLEQFDGKLDELEKSRVGAYRALAQSVEDLLKVHLPQLHRETASLVQALRQPQTRGRWGETQLRRVVELAGMLDHCDFDEQVTLDAYLAAVEAPDEETRQRRLVQHARQVRAHVDALSGRAYCAQFDPTPEFVVLFVPGEAFFSAALTEDPTLIDYAAQNRVILASPTTLIALLKAVAYGWRQEALAKNAAEVAALGKELYERIGKLAEHWSRLGERIGQAVDAYNGAVGTLESRVLPAARRFRELGAVGDGREIERVEPVTKGVRGVVAEDLGGGRSED